MKFLFFLLIVTPAFACKMTPEVAHRRAESAVIDVVARKLGHRNLKAFQRKGVWYVRTTRLNCEDYKVDIDYGSGDCKITGKIIEMKPCK